MDYVVSHETLGKGLAKGGASPLVDNIEDLTLATPYVGANVLTFPASLPFLEEKKKGN